jgi:uncharacterized protein (DUF58 family)
VELFPPEFLKQLEGLHLLARQIARGRQRSERRSAKRGAGIEFADYRGFTPGDDIRGIDWGLFARARQLLLKLFEEEEDLHVHLLLDCTESMRWGTPSKFDQGRRLVAGLAFLALANLDRAGVVPIGPASQRPWSPSRGRARFLQLLHYLTDCTTATGAVELTASVRQWLSSKPRRGLVIWVTDLWGATPDDAFLALDRIRYARQELGVIQIRHPDEITAGELGEFELEEVESGTAHSVIIDRGAAAAYAERVATYESALADYCRKYGIARLQCDASTPVIDTLRQALHSGGFVR